MRSVMMAGLVALLATGMAFGQSQIDWTLELGGDNNAADHELGTTPMPYFVSGQTTDGIQVTQGDDLTWAVRVTVSGNHSSATGEPGHNKATKGAANLVFDLELYEADGVTPVADFGAAPMACDAFNPGEGGALNCQPTDGGFWSSINDGDSDNQLPSVVDLWANGAFTVSIYADTYPATYPTDTLYRLIDPLPGPNFDYGWYPTSNGRGGIDTAGTKAIDTTVSTVNSKLVGFGAGYKAYDATSYRAGVGIASLGFLQYGYGTDRPLFEGQINTAGLPAGTYVLKVVPSDTGNNVVHGDVVWNSLTPNYGGFGSFAVQVNQNVVTQANGITFEVLPPACEPEVIGRYVYYNNSYHDGYNAAIQPIAGGTNHDDDLDAIDTNKAPLMVGDGQATFANWTGFMDGITGLMYEIQCPDVDPVQGDFTFTNKGKNGTGSTAVTPASFLVQPTADPDIVQVFVTFTGVTNCWLEVTIGTGFGLAAPETHWWGNVRADSGSTTGTQIPVNATDELAARNNPSGFFKIGPTNVWDYNKDGSVNATDQLAARNNPSGFFSVQMITR